MKSREPREKVLVRARMNAGGGWHDTCILNVSSRGLLLQSAAAPARGAFVEIRHRGQLIVAQVIWRKKHRFGVKTQAPLPVAAMIANIDLPKPAAAVAARGERRAAERTKLPAEESSRYRGRAIEFGFAAALAAFLAVTVANEVHAILAAPFDRIALTLGR